MAAVTLEQLKEQISFTDDIGEADDALLTAKLNAAQGFIESQLGFTMQSRFTDEGDEIPPALSQAILQLAAWWYDQRETANVGNIVSEVPFGVTEIVTSYRDWCF